MRNSLRDIRIVLRSVWVNLALFAGLLAGVSAVLKLTQCYGDASWGAIVVKALYMTRLEGAMDGCRNPVIAGVLVYITPVLAIVILGEGVLRLTGIYLSRKQRGQDWEAIMVETLSGHTVLCGAGELGRALLEDMLARSPQTQIVVVDTHSDILHELGMHRDNVHHICGDMTSLQTLCMANVGAAKTVIVASGDDAHNLEAGMKVLSLNPNGQVWIRLYRAALSEFMDTASKPNLHFFSPYVRAAKALLEGMGQ